MNQASNVTRCILYICVFVYVYLYGYLWVIYEIYF